MVNTIKSPDIKLETLSDRLRYALKTLDVSQTELAESIHQPLRVITSLCNNRKLKNSSYTVEIADILGINVEWLARGKGYMKPEDDPIYNLVSIQNRIPLIAYSQLKSDYQKLLSIKDEVKKWTLTDAVISDHGFATIIPDQAMYPRFEQGTTIIIDPDKQPNNNDYVLAHIQATNEIVFRQIEYKNDKEIFLRSLNTSTYKSITLASNDKIIGTLIEARWSR